MVTNISFDAWADYLGDAPLAMATHDLSIYAAARDLCHLLGIEIPYLASDRFDHRSGT